MPAWIRDSRLLNTGKEGKREGRPVAEQNSGMGRDFGASQERSSDQQHLHRHHHPLDASVTHVKAFLASLMVLATFMTACNAQCYAITLDSDQECKDINGVIHPLNSKWTNSNCEECYCREREISCCNLVLEPVGFDAKCEKIFHKSNCSYTVEEKNNPGKPCSVNTWVV
ncbi:Hypothetical predicted protein [Marmota monax]|uniref:Beta-microseminoprotein n=1 Tax=Marmota monax TaxID=9995 RepID=A0A5E4CF75_MARMO|nr:Hypothetical predicted protein [Marmota monax]